MTTTTPVKALAFDDVIDAMRSIQTEGDRWHLAETLQQLIPNGSNGFGDIIDAATAEGVVGKLSATTLRLYRDTASRWPADKRVANVSFSAHREAMVLPSIPEAAKMLSDLVKNQGAGKVTVASVRKAVAVKQGKPAPTPRGVATAKQLDVINDLVNGATQLIAAIPNDTEPSKLDTIQSGLSKAMAHVERLRSKAARKAQAAKKSTTPTTPASVTPAKATPAKKATGDLRGL